MRMRWSGLGSVKKASEGSVGEMVKLRVSGREIERAIARAEKSAESLVVAVRNGDERQEGRECGSNWVEAGLERMWGEMERARRLLTASARLRERGEGKWITLKLQHMLREREWIRECIWMVFLSWGLHRWEGTAAEW